MGKRTTGEIGKRLRFEVFKRDNFTCVYCGGKPPDVTLQADHVIPVSKGGRGILENLVAACSDCNAGKSNKGIDEALSPIKIEPEKVAKRIALMQERDLLLVQELEIRQASVNRLLELWDTLNKTSPPGSPKFSFTKNMESGLHKIVPRLKMDEIAEAMTIAVRKCDTDTYDCDRYFFGICWRKIKQNQEICTSKSSNPS